jgi:hypothetical protein
MAIFMSRVVGAALLFVGPSRRPGWNRSWEGRAMMVCFGLADGE